MRQTNPLLFRLGQVCWWAGAVVLGLYIIAAVAMLTQPVLRPENLMIGLVAASILTVPAWALSFILTGSFWKPPKAPEP